MYLHYNIADCKEAGDHLTSCDKDGYCNNCGEQASGDEDSEETGPNGEFIVGTIK